MSGRSVTKSGGVIAAFTMLSRCLGLTRDMLMAGIFGTGIYMSAFVVAFTIPNLFRRLFGEGALSAAFIPVFIEAKRREGTTSAWILARRVITLVGLFLAAIVIVGIIAISLFLQWTEPGGMIGAVLPLLRIMLPYMFFICLAALAMAILNSFKVFGVSAAMPCLLNIVWISCLLIFVPAVADAQASRIKAVAWAVVIAGVAQLLGQIPSLWKRGYRPGLDFDFSAPKVRRVFTLMGPAALGLAVTQINVVVDRLLAAWIGDWAPAALFFSERLIYLPLGVFATAVGTALLPTLSEHAAADDAVGLRNTLSTSIRNLLFVLIPSAVGLLVLAKPIIRLLFGWGAFGETSVAQSAIALQFYAPGLIVFGLAKMLVPTFYAHQDTKTPVKLSIATVLLNLVLNLTFVLTWPTEIKHAGLALATVLAESFYVVALTVMLKRKGIGPNWRIILPAATAILIAVAAMGIFASYSNQLLSAVMANAGLQAKVAQAINVVGTILASIMVFAVTCLAMMKIMKIRIGR